MSSSRVLVASTAFLRLRPAIVAPVMATTLGLLVRAGVPAAQVRAAAVGFSAMLSFFVWEALRARRITTTPHALLASMLVTQVGIGLGCAVTGGARGPLLPMLLAPTVVGIAAFGRTRRSAVVLGGASLVLVALACLPVGVPFPPLPAAVHGPLSLVATAAATLLAATGALTLGEGYDAARTEVEAARDAAVDAAVARVQAIAALGAQVAHEIKNPLASVQGLAELLAEETRDAKNEKRLSVMRAEVARIEGIVRDYLAYARPLAAGSTPGPFDVGALAHRVAETLEGRATRAGVTLSVRGGATAFGDATRLEEAVLNVALNALAAARSTVDLVVQEGPEGVVLRVADDGPGMPPSTVARLGTPFFTTTEGGTGLGVLLARQAAERHGGTLGYVSREGEGTIATFTWPVAEPGGAP